MAGLEVSLLGAPRIERDGRPIDVDTRKATALLAYLAVTGTVHARDHLAGLLWPEYDQEHARGALRRTLSVLRKALDDRWVTATRTTIGVEQDDLRVDVVEFRSLIAACSQHGHSDSDSCPRCIPPLTEAAELHRGDFLAGFSLRDSIAFEDWQFIEAESLRRELGEALAKLSRALAADGQLERAIVVGKRRLGLDPLNEPAHRELMLLHAEKGDRAAALQQYRDCVALLDRELGVPPLDETTELYAAITEGRIGELRPTDRVVRRAPSRNQEPAAPTRYPLVGRGREYEAMLAAYEGIDQDGTLIGVTGEPGIGKTRLLEEFRDEVRSRGAISLATRAYEAEVHLAYSLVIQCLRESLQHGNEQELRNVGSNHLAEAARLLPEFTQLGDLPEPLPLDTAFARARLFEGVAQVLIAAARSSCPGVIFVDDLHWADEASLELLGYLARRLERKPICLVAAWRSGEDDRLQGVIANVQPHVIPLARLSEQDVAELLEAREDDSRRYLAPRLFIESEGLPLFVTEYMATLAATATEQQDWRLPTGVRDLLARRLASLSETGRQLLGTASVIGRSFAFDTVRRVSGRDELEAVSGLEELMARQLLRSTGINGGASYDFTHDKLRSFVYDELTPARRRLLHARVAEALVVSTAREQLPLLSAVIAEHHRLGGNEAHAADYHRVAGEYARSVFANADALAHFENALALGHPATAELNEAIGDLHTLLGRYKDALASYETAAAIGTPDEIPRLEHKIALVHERRGDVQLAETHLRAALEGGDDGHRARVIADLSLVHHRRGNAAAALSTAQEALALAQAAGDLAPRAQAHNILGVLATGRREFDQAEEHLSRSLQLAEEMSDPTVRVAALNNLALEQRAKGDLAAALRLTQDALEACERHGDRHREAALHNNMADLLHALGRSDDAIEHLKQAARSFAQVGEASGGMLPEVWKLVEW